MDQTNEQEQPPMNRHERRRMYRLMMDRVQRVARQDYKRMELTERIRSEDTWDRVRKHPPRYQQSYQQKRKAAVHE